MRLILPLERIRLNFKLEDLMRKIQMVDLKSQYQSIKEEVKVSMDEVLESTAFINGPKGPFMVPKGRSRSPLGSLGCLLGIL